jgi:hypothetical protein
MTSTLNINQSLRAGRVTFINYHTPVESPVSTHDGRACIRNSCWCRAPWRCCEVSGLCSLAGPGRGGIPSCMNVGRPHNSQLIHTASASRKPGRIGATAKPQMPNKSNTTAQHRPPFWFCALPLDLFVAFRSGSGALGGARRAVWPCVLRLYGLTELYPYTIVPRISP